MLHGDGEPLLIEYCDANTHFCYVVMMSDIASFSKFEKRIERGKWYDWETPYGYGGPLSDSLVSKESEVHFLKEIREYALEKGVISQFLRFHPLLSNDRLMSLSFETRYLRDTIFIDTANPELVMKNMDSKNRNMVRKAIKSGVTIERNNVSEYDDFLLMYEETMKKDNADDYYTFGNDYFEAQRLLENNASLFYAVYEGRPIAGAIIYYNDKFAHYHLAGTHTEYRKYAPSNLMLYEVACWASERGIRKFHLGGGISAEDNLFGFKKQFNKQGRLPFVVGKTVFNQKEYDNLLNLRKLLDPGFEINNNRMIQYRY